MHDRGVEGQGLVAPHQVEEDPWVDRLVAPDQQDGEEVAGALARRVKLSLEAAHPELPEHAVLHGHMQPAHAVGGNRVVPGTKMTA